MNINKDISGENMNIILVGPPGCGKGTQTDAIVQRFGVKPLSTGNLLRSEIQQQTQLGKTAKQYMDKGELLPDNIILSMVEQELTEQQNVLFDGFPRTIAQAQGLDNLFEKLQRQIDVVIEIQVPDQVIIERLSQRRVNIQTGATYHLTYNPPPEGEQVIQREDDMPHVIAGRLTVYHQQTAPLITYYQQQGKLISVDGQAPIEQVCEQIISKLDEFLNPQNP